MFTVKGNKSVNRNSKLYTKNEVDNDSSTNTANIYKSGDSDTISGTYKKQKSLKILTINTLRLFLSSPKFTVIEPVSRGFKKVIRIKATIRTYSSLNIHKIGADQYGSYVYVFPSKTKPVISKLVDGQDV